MKAYYWLNKSRLQKALEEGITPPGSGAVKIDAGNGEENCVCAYMHPADGKTELSDAVCLKIQVDSERVFIAEGASIENRFERTAVPAKKYILGTYRRPVVLIPFKIGPEMLEKYNGQFDEALLYENSEKLYIDRCFTFLDETDPKFREKVLEAYWSSAAREGRAVEITGNTVVFPENRIMQDKETASADETDTRSTGLKKIFRKYKSASKTVKAYPDGDTAAQTETTTEYLGPDGSTAGIIVRKS